MADPFKSCEYSVGDCFQVCLERAERQLSMVQRSKIDSLRDQAAKIQARITELERRTKAQSRKEDTRLKVIVGAACLADAKIHQETQASLQGILRQAVTALQRAGIRRAPDTHAIAERGLGEKDEQEQEEDECGNVSSVLWP